MKSIFFDEVDNTQDFAMNEFKEEPLLIVSKAQTSGRGTNQNNWQNADQSLATSLVFNKKIVNFMKKGFQLNPGSKEFYTNASQILGAMVSNNLISEDEAEDFLEDLENSK